MGGSLLDPALAFAADVLDDLERVRIANENRLRQLTRVGLDKDGLERGFGLTAEHPDVLLLTRLVDALTTMEADAAKNLQKKMRQHPLGAWVKRQKGVGDKQAARLLAAIGDPYINSAKGTPRTVSALWAYSGLHVLPADQATSDDLRRAVDGVKPGDPSHIDNDNQSGLAGVAARRRRGERANWSTTAKMRAYLIAESCIKQLHADCRDGHSPLEDHGRTAVPAAPQPDSGQLVTDAPSRRAAVGCGCSPYRVVYDSRRARTATTHPDWSDGHSHNDALRVASKAVLKDLWRAARDWHHAQARGG